MIEKTQYLVFTCDDCKYEMGCLCRSDNSFPKGWYYWNYWDLGKGYVVHYCPVCGYERSKREDFLTQQRS